MKIRRWLVVFSGFFLFFILLGIATNVYAFFLYDPTTFRLKSAFFWAIYTGLWFFISWGCAVIVTSYLSHLAFPATVQRAFGLDEAVRKYGLRDTDALFTFIVTQSLRLYRVKKSNGDLNAADHTCYLEPFFHSGYFPNFLRHYLIDHRMLCIDKREADRKFPDYVRMVLKIKEELAERDRQLTLRDL